MKAPYDPRTRLAAIQPVNLDGAPYWPLRETCQAFRIANQAAASKLIPAECKRYLLRELQRYDTRRSCYIDREGVRALALRFARIPLHQVLDALRDS